jgi:hypothetical protein
MTISNSGGSRRGWRGGVGLVAGAACLTGRIEWPAQPYADRRAVFIGLTLGSFRPSRCEAPTMRATAMSDSTAS